MGYDQNILAQVSVFNITPNGSEASFWNSGAGPAADSSGNIYQLAANGTFDSMLNANGFPAKGDFGNAFLKRYFIRLLTSTLQSLSELYCGVICAYPFPGHTLSRYFPTRTVEVSF